MTRLDRRTVLGWDIGGANTKAARIDNSSVRWKSVAYELRLDPGALVPTLRRLARDLGADTGPIHAVTMTAELSQFFRTKREGVAFVLDALAAGFPGDELRVYTVSGRFVSPAEALAQPLEAAASNWAATARLVAQSEPDCILIDIGTTSTDVIPILQGEMASLGRTDPERLLSRELLYTGAVRTPVEAIARTVPLWGGNAPVSAEGFALIGDAHLWLGRLPPDDYTVTPPDGRPATREYAGERLARVVCADREMLDSSDIDALAEAVAEAQVREVADAVAQVRARHPSIDRAVVAGLGDFIAVAAAKRAGLQVSSLADRLGGAARTAPAFAVASLLSGQLQEIER
jgi:(4-(4-[2-(gamma-L-glutamylamino)ethyl]phenoxymethyl)furan-2-yl)methanamine synthase